MVTQIQRGVFRCTHQHWSKISNPARHHLRRIRAIWHGRLIYYWNILQVKHI